MTSAPGIQSGFLTKASKGRQETLLYDGPIKCFKDDRHEVMTFGAFDLFESLDIIMFGTIHDREDLSDEARFTAGPLASGTVIS